MYKKLLLAAALFFTVHAGYAQYTVKQLFKEFSRVEHINRVSVGKLSVRIGKLADVPLDFKSVEVLELGKADAAVQERFADAVRNLNASPLKPMISTDKGGKTVKVLVRDKGGMIRELVVLFVGNSKGILRVRGKIRQSDVMSLIDKF